MGEKSSCEAAPTARLIHGDCLSVLPALESGSVDMILADPPYGTTACKWDTVIPLEPLWRELKRIVKPRGVVVMTASQPFTSVMVMSNPKWFRHEWVWIKDHGGNFANTVREPLKEHESVLVFSAGRWTYNRQKQKRSPGGVSRAKYHSAADLKSECYRIMRDRRGPRDEMRVPSSWQKFNTERGLHPTQKPVALMAYLIRTYTQPGETVLDFCMGSGTTGVACAHDDRNFIGIELDPTYFATAQRRMAEAQSAGPLFEGKKPVDLPDMNDLRGQS